MLNCQGVDADGQLHVSHAVINLRVTAKVFGDVIQVHNQLTLREGNHPS